MNFFVKINFIVPLFCALIVILFSFETFSQPARNWQNLDLETNGVFGVSTEKAYNQLLKDKVAIPVVVAVIDGGIDINNEDLKNVIWTNIKEVPNNKKDDDHNGYIDDIHGWNFLGSSKGNFQQDNAEIVRLLRVAQENEPNSTKTLELHAKLASKKKNAEVEFEKLQIQRNALLSILKKIGKENPDLSDFQSYKYSDESELNILVYTVSIMKQTGSDFREFKREFERKYLTYKNQIDYVLNIDYNPRGGNGEYLKRYHGNSDVIGLGAYHATHCAGIIAAERNNNVGINGVAEHAQIMVLRTVPEGDMLDEDLCSAIRYAADNGAKIINLSFNKQVSTDKRAVDEAVKYAMSKDVLIVHAVGNEGKEEQSELSFPNRNYEDGGEALAWIEVGATGPVNDETLLAPFSNYGKRTTDVFAPGVKITSTYPENTYEVESGTSMATPVVSGLAALIRAYYPKLSALEVKKIILNSVRKVEHPVKNNLGALLNFSDICVSGGIVNVYNAVKLADETKQIF